MYCVLTIPSLQKKRLLIFEIFNIKKYTLFTGDEYIFSSLPKEKCLDLSKFKAFADNKINVAKIMISVDVRVENMMGWEKEKILLTSIFFFFQQSFKETSLSYRMRYRISKIELEDQCELKIKSIVLRTRLN